MLEEIRNTPIILKMILQKNIYSFVKNGLTKEKGIACWSENFTQLEGETLPAEMIRERDLSCVLAHEQATKKKVKSNFIIFVMISSSLL